MSGMACRWIAAGLGVALMATGAMAQLTPDRTYYGVDRAIPMTIARPGGAEGDLAVRLLEPATARVVAEESAVEGKVDLAGLFPLLWMPGDTGPKPLYAQLVIGEKPVGPAVVLVPMVTPRYATHVSQSTGLPVYQDMESRVYSGLTAMVDRHVVFETSLGRIVFAMRPDAAPNTVNNFVRLADGGFYTGVIFHRVVAQAGNGHPFVIQVGDPTGIGSGGPGYFLDLEPSSLAHDFGVLSMARTNDPNTNGSQVFICLSREGTAFLDGRYTAFAETIEGADVVMKISAVEVGEGDRPVDPPLIERAYLVDAPPYTGRIECVKRPEPKPQPR